MRLPRPRLTVRRLMVLVAVLGLILGMGVLGWRWNHCRYMAGLCEEQIIIFQDELTFESRYNTQPEYVPELRKQLAWWERQARRYRAAQRRPWLAVPDDHD